MDLRSYFDSHLAEHRQTLERLSADLYEPFEDLAATCSKALRKGCKILFFGNGGSAADAQHLATEFVVRFSGDRRPLAALALTTDTSTLTAAANDYGYETVFARQVEALAAPGDVAIGISTSGNSENVVRGLQAASRIGAVPVAWTGLSGGRALKWADQTIRIPSETTARIQEMHILIGHLLIGAVERELELIQ